VSRRSFWAWGLEQDEPNEQQVREAAARLSQRYGVAVEPVMPPRSENLRLRPPRISPPSSLAAICATDGHDRAVHTYGRSFRDRIRAYNLQFPNPPDVVAHPTTEDEVTAVLDWCSSNGYAAIPYGGGSSTVAGFEPPEGYDGIVTIDLSALDQVLEVDDVSRAARIQAGAYGPGLEAQLRPHGFTLRHYPQSFEFSSLGGWIATRSGGHYATNHTHIDDFVESVRMVTPTGVWESRRLPGSGAGPSPDRMAIGSEGILGIITEAWMRIQARPQYRASAGVTYPSFMAGSEAARRVVQAKLWPANCRLLDPVEAQAAAGMDGSRALLIIGFESSDLPQDENIRQAVAIARDAGGTIAEEDIRISAPGDRGGDSSGGDTGRQGAVGAWRNAFIGAPYQRNITTGMGLVAETLETAITWERWPAMDEMVRGALQETLDRVCGGGSVSCRFTHVYPDGPAPYYTWEGMGRRGAELEMYAEIKQAASDAIMAAGGTITHHHAVGRLHRPWYDRQRPEPFAEALRAAKRALDPNGVLNPGLLVDV
jgi:alkyldihydroxyacetonephosphate synthase